MRRCATAALAGSLFCALPGGIAFAELTVPRARLERDPMNGRARFAQQPTPYQPTLRKPTPDVLDRAAKLLKAGKPEEALDAIEGFEPVPAVLRVRVEAAAALGRVGLALDSYDRLETLLGKPDPETLGVLAYAVLDEVGRSGDPLLQVESCRVEATAGRTACVKTLAKVADDPATPITLQAQALSVLVKAGDARARTRLDRLASSARGPDRRAAIDAARYLPADGAVRVLADVLKSDQPDLQYGAASALGDLTPPVPAARAALEQFLAGKPTTPGRVAAELALASLGDPAMLKSFADSMDRLGTGELLRVASLLAARGDPRGVAGLERVLASDNDVMRVRAAARLATARPELARDAMKTALASDNLWLRAAALEEFAASPLLDLTTTRRALADPDPWVRLRAASAVLDRLARGIADPPRAKPARQWVPQGL